MSCINRLASPPITSYQQIALPLSVAMLNPSAPKWFYSNYIQVSCVNREHYLTHDNIDNSLHYNFYNPEITFPAPADHIKIEGKEQLFAFEKPDFIKWAIDDGWCLYTDADMYYINGSDSCGKYHYSHDLLIYGYENDNLLIYMYDSTKLSEHIVSFADFVKGYYSKYSQEDTYRNRAILFRPNEKEFEFDVDRIRWHMHDYLDGTETFARERPNIFNPDSLTMNGMNTYAQFASLFDYAMQREYKELRRVDLYCFYEHKKIMFDRVNLLNEENVLSASDELVIEFEDIMKNAQMLMMLGLKSNRMKDPNKKNITLMHMKELVGKIKNSEEAAWNRYIAENKGLLG